MWPTILTLLIAGVLLLVVEVFVPGLIVGTAGALALIAATILTYTHYGAHAGNLLLAAEIAGGVVFIFWWLRYVPHSSFARRWSLGASVDASVKSEASTLIGQSGTEVSPLRPSGIAEVGGIRLDVVTEGDLIPVGHRVRVITVEGNRIVVRREESSHEVSA